MDKRTRLLIVILLGLILLGIGLWIFLSPILKQNAAQPPALPAQPSQQPAQPAPTNTAPKQAPVVAPTPNAKPTPQSGILALQNKVSQLAERMGSGTNENGFLGYSDALIDATANGRTQLLAAQKAMQAQHPASGPAYGITARAVTSNVDSGKYGDAQVVISMDVFVSEDAGNPGKPTAQSGHKVTMTMAKQADGSYLMDSFTWK